MSSKTDVLAVWLVIELLYYFVTDVAVYFITDMEKTNSEYEKKSPSSADTRIRKYQVRKLSSTNVH